MSPMIQINNLYVKYASGTPFQRNALEDVSFTVEKGEFRAIIGSQGSGKSTLLQIIAGLIAGEGTVNVCGSDLQVKRNRNHIWQQVGLIFQYPEKQLFEDTLWHDVSYGPRNMGLSEPEVSRRVKVALDQVQLGEEYYELSPFKLSGGQQRRAAIAGVLAMEPQILLLDEPTAGLDPSGKRQLMNLFEHLCKEKQVTVLLVTHDMEEVAHRADKITILNQGKVALEGSPREVFCQVDILKNLGLAPPFAAGLSQALRARGLAVPFTTTLNDLQKGVEKILTRSKGKG